MIHTSESDVTSLSTSSSPTSPKRPLYYVQSPSRDSHDDADNKSSSSVHAATTTTPTYIGSPMDSPSHPSTSTFWRHSRATSASRVSGNLRPNRRRNDRGWKEFNVINEESDCDEMHGGSVYEQWRCHCLMAAMGFAAAFTLFCLIIWGASKSYRTHIEMKSFTVSNFYCGQGSDFSGVPTKLLTVNCSFKMNVYNPATFFGIHITSSPVNLFYSKIVVARGQLKKYYQPRKSQQVVTVKLEGRGIPLYGAGEGFLLSENSEVPLELAFEILSRGNVVGKLVKSKHRIQISCSLVIKPSTMKTIQFKDSSCTYN